MPPARETSLHFKLAGRPPFKLHFPPDATELLIRTARSSSTSTTTACYVLDHLFSRFAIQTSVQLERFNLVRVILGDVQLDCGVGVEPRLRFFKGADESKVVARVLEALIGGCLH